MGKELREMTKEELWALFPIYLVEPDDRWTVNYAEIELVLREALKGQRIDRISHIGSTAVHGIWAKDIVDVLVEMPEDVDLEAAAATLPGNGFRLMYSEPDRVALNKGYTEEGFAEKVYHIHIRHTGDNDELYFRDYLNEHPQVAGEYEALKLGLWKRYEHNRDAYTEAKTEFIRERTAEARRLYGARYM